MTAWKKIRRFWAKLIGTAKGRTPSGPTADSWTWDDEEEESLTIKGPAASATLTVNKAKELIFDRLCREYQARGAGAGLESETLRSELGIHEELFRWALTEMTSGTSASGLYVDRDYTGKRISLGRRGQIRCQDGVNPFATGEPAKK